MLSQTGLRKERRSRAQSAEDRRLLGLLVAFGYVEKRRRSDGRVGYWPTPAWDAVLQARNSTSSRLAQPETRQGARN